MHMRRILIVAMLLGLVLSVNAQTYSNLVPQPLSVVPEKGAFCMDGNLTVYADKGLEFEAGYLKGHLDRVFAFDVPLSDRPMCCGIILRLEDGMQDESYSLRVGCDRIEIKASGSAGIFYGIQTLLQMMPPAVYGDRNMELKQYRMDAVTVSDCPRFGYRGAMLDVSRTFYDAEHVMRLLDWMAYHKLNRFHWHLADDNGWRIEIKKYPSLTSEGAWRGDGEVSPAAYGQGHGRYGGYYTQKEIRRIVEYASERHITIIPEIDLPGHSRSLIGVFPEMACEMDVPYISANGETDNVLCVARKENYKVLDNIFKEVAALFPSEYIHVGGDEVDLTSWTNCPHCQAMVRDCGFDGPEELLGYFMHRMQDILAGHGKKMAGWDEIVEEASFDNDPMVYVWRSVATGRKSIEKGYRTVVQIGEYCYLDMKQHPAERGHSWAGLVPLEKTYSLEPDEILADGSGKASLVAGVQAGLWTELMAWPPRFMEHQYFPRLCALAEVGWSSGENRNYDDFRNRLYSGHFSRLYDMGIAFRVAPPDVLYDGQSLHVFPPHPSAVVRYTSDGSDPVPSSPVCRGSVESDTPENFRFATFFGEDLKSIAVGASNVDLYGYVDPEITVETNIPLLEGNLQSLACRGKAGYSRRVLQAGDTLSYIMADPVECSRITVRSGVPSSGMFYVTDAVVEYSTEDGVFIPAGELYNGELSFVPSGPVKEVRMVITAPNDAYTAVFQGLFIEK